MKKSSLGVIHLEDEEKKKWMDAIADFFLDEWDEDIGVIKQEAVLDLFTEELAPMVYNKALDDARLWYSRKQDDLATDFEILYQEQN